MTLDTSITSRVVRVGPRMAQDFLNRSPHRRRPLQKARVSGYARAMSEGKWRITNQGLALDNNGFLVDGQHRLHAIIEAGVSVDMLIVYGVSHDDAVKYVDRGITRTLAHALTIQGETNAAIKAAICRVIWLAESGSGLSQKAESEDITEVLERRRGPIEAVIAAGTRSSINAAPLAAMALSYEVSKGPEFLDGVTSGVGLSVGDPRLALRNRFIGRPCPPSGAAAADRFMRTVASIDAWLHGESQDKATISTRRYKRWCKCVEITVSQALVSFADNFNGR